MTKQGACIPIGHLLNAADISNIDTRSVVTNLRGKEGAYLYIEHEAVILEAKKEDIKKLFSCGKNEVIPYYLTNDSIPDCFDGDDESLDSNQLFSSNLCNDITNLPCFPGDTTNFPLHSLCIYEIHEQLGPGFLKFCRNGKHLANCTHFVCPHHFKCQDYYCIPLKYTCDNKTDCPFGDDEKECIERSCTGLFHCSNSSTCLHFHDVGDGIIDCQHGDDELYRDLSACPFGCTCLMDALTLIRLPTFHMS